MADSKLSALSSGSAIADADLFYSDQGGSSVKQAASALSNYINKNTLLGVYSAVPNNPGIGYVQGDTVNITGGTTQTLSGYLAAVQLAVVETQVVSATVAAGGSGGTNGTQTVTGTTGTSAGGRFQAVVTIAGGAITAVQSISVPGNYSINPTSLTVEPVTGASLTGAQLNVVMGVKGIYVTQSGSYSTAPTLVNNSQSSTSGGGTGLTVDLIMLPIASIVAPAPIDVNAAGILGENCVYGFKAGSSLTTGGENCMIGFQSGVGITTGSFNTLVNSGVLLTGNCSGNVGIGMDSIRNGVTLSGVVAIGQSALKAYNGTQVTAGICSVGTSSMLNWNSTTSPNPSITAIGTQAGQGAAGATYINATIVGYQAGLGLTSANGGVALFGRSAGNKITTGSGLAIGDSVASTTWTTGLRNIVIGCGTNADLATSGTNDSIVICGQSTTTPWVTGSMATGAQTASFGGTVKPLVTVVGSLPSAATVGVGASAFVTDANTTIILGIGIAVVGGGSNKVPVYSDGTNWIVG